MLTHTGSIAHASTWRPDPGEIARWETGAAAHLGDLAVWHHPRLASTGLTADPAAGRLHFLDWAPPSGGGPSLPLALVETTRHFGPLRVPVLTWPTHGLYVYSAAAAAPGLLEACLSRALDAAAWRPRFLPHLPLDTAEAARAAGRGAPKGRIYAEDVAPRVRLAAGWQGDWTRYWSARADGLRREVPRVRRRMEESGGLEFRSVRSLQEPDAEMALMSAMTLHAGRWGARVHRESDMSEGSHRERLLGLARHFDQAGALRLDWLVWKGSVAALVLGATCGRTRYFYWATFDPAAARYSPGNVLYARLLEEAFLEGMATADFMFGDEPYKQRWTDDSPALSAILQPGPGAGSALLFRALEAARRLAAVARPGRAT